MEHIDYISVWTDNCFVVMYSIWLFQLISLAYIITKKTQFRNNEVFDIVVLLLFMTLVLMAGYIIVRCVPTRWPTIRPWKVPADATAQRCYAACGSRRRRRRPGRWHLGMAYTSHKGIVIHGYMDDKKNIGMVYEIGFATLIGWVLDDDTYEIQW